jgi:internalin A
MVVANAYKNDFRYAPIIFISITYHSKKGRASKLTNLDLSGNQITDVQPLAELTNLTVLNLEYNKIFNHSVLFGLINLKNLNLSSNQIRIQICPVKPASICKF